MHEDYISPVGFAREPRTERSRWVKRVALFIFVAFVGWMLVTKVIAPPEDSRRPGPATSSILPGPL